jgi:hypothetical protein
MTRTYPEASNAVLISRMAHIPRDAHEWNANDDDAGDHHGLLEALLPVADPSASPRSARSAQRSVGVFLERPSARSTSDARQRGARRAQPRARKKYPHAERTCIEAPRGFPLARE